MKILKALLAASLLAPLPALAGAPPIPPAPTIIVGGGTPVTGTCPSTQFLYNNAGILGCSAGSGASSGVTLTSGFPALAIMKLSPAAACSTRRDKLVLASWMLIWRMANSLD